MMFKNPRQPKLETKQLIPFTVKVLKSAYYERDCYKKIERWTRKGASELQLIIHE